MRRMCRRLQRLSACVLFAAGLILGIGTTLLSQAPAQAYVIPRFSSNPGSELLISNLSNRSVTASVMLTDFATQQAVSSSITLQAGTQQHVTTVSLGLSTFTGSVTVNSTAPLAIIATITDGAGRFENAQPVPLSGNLIVPFGPATAGAMNLTILNPGSNGATVLIAAIGADSSTLATQEALVPAFGAVILDVNALAAQAGSSFPREISHLSIHSLSNVFSSDKSVYVQATLRGFSAANEGVPGPNADPAIAIPALPTDGVTRATVPFFVQGGDYITLVQVINVSSGIVPVTLTVIGTDGNAIDGINPVVVQIPPNGSVRHNLKNIFNFPASFTVGSITVESPAPVIVTTAIASATQGGLLLAPATLASTNFAFRTRAADPAFYLGVAFRNQNATPANLTILNVPDSILGISSTSLTIPPFALVSRTLSELLPEARTAGFIYISSDVPVFAQAIEGRNDNSLLANLPAMHSQPGYVPPVPNTFLIAGTARNNGSPLPGVSVELSGALRLSAVTDENGNYQFANVPAGQYTVTAALAGYTLSPTSVNVTVAGASLRGIDFASTTSLIPTITLLQPSGVLAGSAATVLIVAGGPFLVTSEILFENSALPTILTTAGVPVTVVSGTGQVSVSIQTQTVLKTTIPADRLIVARVASVAVRTNGPGGSVTSATQPFSVGNSAPTITGLLNVPQPLLAGNSGFTILVTGGGFTPGTTVFFDTTAISTTFISDTQLQADVPASVLSDGGVHRITALKPQPTIGPSNSLSLFISSPVPGLTSISPNISEARVNENALPLQMIVQGFGFVKSSIIQIDGTAVSTTYHSSTELLGSIPQALLETARSALISVKNPDPVVLVAHFDPVLPFVLYNPMPTVTFIDVSQLIFDPTIRFVGDVPKFPAQVVIHGANFAKANLGYLFSTPCDALAGGFSGSRLSSTVVTGTINIACTGQYFLGTVNPQPGGGDSTLVSFTVTQYTAATPVTVLGLAPAAVIAGSGSFTLTISGSNFIAGAFVNFGTAVLIPTSITANSIVVTIPGFLIKNADRFPVSVTNPDASENSNRILFNVN